MTRPAEERSNGAESRHWLLQSRLELTQGGIELAFQDSRNLSAAGPCHRVFDTWLLIVLAS